jgi:hypothetical protein
MLTGIGGLHLNHGIRLGQLLETLNKLRQVSGVLDSDSHTHHGRYCELHCLDTASRLEVGDSTCLDKVLIDTNETASVTSGNISDGLGVTSHHDDNTLNALLEKISLLSGLVVRTEDTDLLAGGNLA